MQFKYNDFFFVFKSVRTHSCSFLDVWVHSVGFHLCRKIARRFQYIQNVSSNSRKILNEINRGQSNHFCLSNHSWIVVRRARLGIRSWCESLRLVVGDVSWLSSHPFSASASCEAICCYVRIHHNLLHFIPKYKDVH